MSISFKRLRDYLEWHRTCRVRLGEEFHEPLLTLLSMLEPRQAKGVSKIRIGAARDGGYVMLDDFQGIEEALSLGVGPDVSWDLALAEKGIPVGQFDHTVDALPCEHPLFHFEKKKVTARESSGKTVILSELLQTRISKAMVLKIDIEGDEWDILAATDPSLLRECRQIVVEFHNFLSIQNEPWRDQAQRALAVLAHDFGVVHVHGNNLARRLLVRDRQLPDTLEVTLANRRFYELGPTREIFPGSFDKKNNPFFPDFSLGSFSFPK